MTYRKTPSRAAKTPPHVSLRDLRDACGKTLDDVCQAASEVLPDPLTRGAMSAIETGARGASQPTLRALEVAYGLRPGALVTDYTPRRRDIDLQETA